MKKAFRLVLALAILQVAVVAQTSGCREQTEGQDLARRSLERDKLNQDLKNQELWVRSNGDQGYQLILPFAKLDSADFFDADLSWADLQGVHLEGAFRATLHGTDLREASLPGVQFGPVSTKPRADLRRTRLDHADLRSANLEGALLEEASLDCADLRGTKFRWAQLAGAVYSPKYNPDAADIAWAEGLGYLTWETNSEPILSLRKSLIDANFNDAARQVSAAIHRHSQNVIERIVFDWTCEWGANFLRPLKLVLALVLMCTVMYWIGIHFGNRSGLYLAATGERIKTVKGKEHVLRISFRRPPPAKWYRFAPRVAAREMKILSTAFLFSLMSAFNIGFKEFNFGLWIRALQPREFDLKGRGWLRTVSGIQSLVGVALVALSLLSYFGHPFD